jgi:nitrate reductase beta subunit
MSKPSAEIPVIDISPSNSHAATQLLDAATKHGFVFIENNAAAGMPPANVESMFDLVSISASNNRYKIPTIENRVNRSFKVRWKISKNVLRRIIEDGFLCSKRRLILVTKR